MQRISSSALPLPPPFDEAGEEAQGIKKRRLSGGILKISISGPMATNLGKSGLLSEVNQVRDCNNSTDERKGGVDSESVVKAIEQHGMLFAS